jgi:hypothetical protein
MPRVRNTNFPNFDPNWATNSSRTLEPSAGEKGTGWNEGYRVPARKLNWLFQSAYDFAKLGASVIGGVHVSRVSAITGYSLVWDETNEIWIAAGSGPITVYSDTNMKPIGTGWTAGATPTATPRPSVPGDTDIGGRVMFAVTGGTIDYSATPTAGVYVTTAAPFTAADEIKSFKVQPGDNYVMACAATASEVAVSTQINLGWTGGSPYSTAAPFVDVAYISGNGASQTWIGMTSAGVAYISQDTGATWTVVANGPATAVASSTWTSLDCDPVKGIVWAAARLTASPYDARIAYSTDGGTSWTAATMPTATGVGTSTANPIVRHLGGSLVVLTTWIDTANRDYIQVSSDFGKTWARGGIVSADAYSAPPAEMRAIDFNGSVWMAIDDAGYVYSSNLVTR